MSEYSRYLAVLGLLLLGMVWWTWGRISFSVEDTGRALYVSWKISQGAVLYRDVWHIFGPFSTYFYGSLFFLFGARLEVFWVANALWLWAILALLLYSFSQWSSVRTGFWMAFLFLVVFGVSQKTFKGETHYLFPYSPELVHGFTFLLLALLFAERLDKSSSLRKATVFGYGFWGGLVVLTKPEILVAYLVVSAFLLWRLLRQRGRKVWKTLLWGAGGFIVPSLLMSCVFLYQGANLLESLTYPWMGMVITSQVPSEFFPHLYYRKVVGLLEWQGHLQKFWMSCFLKALFIGSVLGVKWLNPSKARISFFVELAYLAAIVTFFLIPTEMAVLFQGIWPYSTPVVCLLGFLYFEGKKTPFGIRLWLIAGVALALKMGFYPNIFHYGFVLLVPLFFLEAYLFLEVLPFWAKRHYVALRWLGALPLIALGVTSLYYTYTFIQSKGPVVQGPGGKLAVFSFQIETGISPSLQEAVQAISRFVPQESTLDILPYRMPFLQFLVRRSSALVCFDPDTLAVGTYGKERYLQDLKSNPPDFVLRLGPFEPRFTSPGMEEVLLEWKKLLEKDYRPIWQSPRSPHFPWVLYRRVR